MTTYKTSTGLPQLPDGLVWYVGEAINLNADQFGNPSPGAFNIKIKRRIKRRWPLWGYTYEDTWYLKILTKFDGQVIDKIEDLTADAIRLAAESLLYEYRMDNDRRQRSTSNTKLLGYYPPNTIGTTNDS